MANKNPTAPPTAPPRRTLTEAEKEKRSRESAAKFVELANKRVPAAIKKIELVGNLSGYKSTTEQVEKILDAVQDALNSTKARLEKTSTTESQFKL